MDWEKPVHFEFYDKNNIKQIDQGAGVKIFGAWSRAHPLKSMALFARKEYGDGSFSYKFFNNRKNDKFEALVLRNAGNDFYQAHLRDGFMGHVMEPLNIESQGFQPTVVYINGEYWGVLNLREKINEHFISDHTYIRADSVNILQNNGDIVQGTNTKYLELLNFIENNNIAIEANYEKVKEYIDIENYMDYMLAQTFIDNRDWPGNNIKFWNTTSNKSRFRWILYDTDFGFNLYGSENYLYNSLADALATNGPNWPNPPWSTLLFRKLKANSEFKEEFVKRAKHYLNTCWKPQVMNAKVDSLKNIYKDEMVDHCQRWNLNYNNWSYEVERLKTFSNNRPYYFEKYLKEIFGFNESVKVNLAVSSEQAGFIKLNQRKINDYPYSENQFVNTDLEVIAVPYPGYRFVKWEGDLTSRNNRVVAGIRGTIAATAIFEPADSEDRMIVFNEVFYKSSESIKPGDWVELFNAGKTSVDLLNWSFSDTQEDSALTISQSILLGPKEYYVLSKDLEKFKTTYPMVNNVYGEFEFGLSSNGDYLRLYDNNGQLVDAVDYYPTGSWPSEANGLGASAELMDATTDNAYGYNWEPSIDGGTPGGPNLSYKDVGIFNPAQQLDADLRCVPNPFQSETNVIFNTSRQGIYKIEITTISGLKVFEGNEIFYLEGMQQLKIKLNRMLPQGMYILSLYGQGKQQSIKVIITN